MEGSAEVNESMENPTEDPHLKRKENDQLHQQTENCIALQRSAPVIAEDTGWTEHLSSLRSPEMLLETLVGKGLTYDSGAHSDSEHPTSSCPSTFPGTFLDELKVSNFNLQNVHTNVSGSGGDDSHIRKGLWNNLTRLAGGSRIDSLPKDLLSVVDRGKLGRSLVKRPLPFPQFAFNHLKAPQNLAECDNPVQSRNTLAFPHPGIRTKVLPASGFQQFLVKSTLKGKGVAYSHQGADKVSRLVTQNQNSVGIDDNVVTTSQPMHKPMAKVNEGTLIDGVGGYAENVQCDGTCLREWLKEKNQKSSRFKRLNMFKKILELVDTSHSQGIALRHIQPSYFVVFPSGLIKYIGSLNTQVQARILKGSKYRDISLESHLKRKSSMEQNTDFQDITSHKQLKIGQGQELLIGPLSLKHLRPGEKNSTVALSRTCPSRSCLKGSLVEEVHNGIVQTKSYDEGFSEEFKLADSFQSHEIPGQPNTFHSSFREPVTGFLNLEDRWYASPEELNESARSLSSNIYRLGVLFFELLCYFETQEVHFAAMSNLRHRILPPSFLSEFPKEASFCLWLLHPDPYSRPKSREILSSNLMFECNNVSAIDQSSASIDEEDAEADILLHFLSNLREQKENQAAKLVADIQRVEADVEEVERRHSSRIESLSNARGVLPSCSDSSDMNPHEVSIQIGTISACSVSNLNEERLMKNIDQLEHAYFSMRSNIELSEPNAATRSDVDVLKVRSNFYQFQDEADIKNESEDHVGTFFKGLCKYARYSKVEVRGSLRNVDILNSANVICSLSFDRDEEYFATAGVSKKIKIFEFGALLNETVDVHYPLVEMSSRSKLSCVSWNYYIKNYLASTDYDGVVQLWDASTGQGFTQYAEHEKRAWSVDFSPVDPTKLASGSDDCSVKLWSIKERNCIDTIRNVANVCCVQFSPHSSHLLTFGSADYKIYCYDLRNTRSPWCILSGHGKAVSYVKFVDCETVVSASTDNTLKLWDLNKTSACGQSTNACRLTFTGHTNEKNFVGLSTFDGYISCGSETNEVYVYHKAFPMCVTSHKFGSIDPITGQETGDDNGQFVSSVCWRTKSSMVVAANSSGNLKLLQMV